MKLPLEYSKLAKYFDLLDTRDPNSINRLIEKIFKKYKAKKILDFTCGTGAQILWLSKRGYKATGVDFSPALLKIARNKAKKAKIKAKLLKGDMRTTQLGCFDAVITIWNAVGHLTKKDFEKAMRNISKNLKKDGLYIFDIFNLNSINKKTLANMKVDVTKILADTKIHHTQYSKLNKSNGRLISYDFFSLQKNANEPKILKEKFALQIYAAKELEYMLAKNGFGVLAQYGMDGSKFSDTKTKEILTIAKKI